MVESIWETIKMGLQDNKLSIDKIGVMAISCIGLIITIGIVVVMIRFTKQHKIFKKRCEAMLCVIINEIFKEYYDNLWNALGTVHYDDCGDVPSEKSET